MIDINEFNSAFLAENHDIARNIERRIRSKFRKAPKVLVMSLKPKYAKAIYEGRKNWEFRKAPPPLFKEIYIYESAPVSKITGTVMFSESITGIAMSVYDLVKRNKTYTKNFAGITLLELEEYAGNKLVTGLRVYESKRIDHEIEFSCKPPQNWGSFNAHYKQNGGAK